MTTAADILSLCTATATAPAADTTCGRRSGMKRTSPLGRRYEVRLCRDAMGSVAGEDVRAATWGC